MAILYIDTVGTDQRVRTDGNSNDYYYPVGTRRTLQIGNTSGTNGLGAVSLILDGQPFQASRYDSVVINGTPAASAAGLQSSINTLFPKANSGSGGSGSVAKNVLDYGVKGDGTTDDTAALQALIASNTTLVMPFGTYKITAPLLLSALSNFKISASQGAVITFAGQSSGVNSYNNQTIFEFRGALSNISIDSINFVNTNTTQAGSDLYGIINWNGFYGVITGSNIVIKNCSFTTGAINLDAVKVTFSNSADVVNKFELLNNNFTTIGRMPFEYHDQTGNTTLKFNDFVAAGNRVGVAGTAGTYGQFVSLAGYGKNWIIVNNNANEVLTHFVEIIQGTNIIVSGNDFISTKATNGVNGSSCTNVNIFGNNIVLSNADASNTRAVNISGNNVIVSNNILRSTGYIYINGCTRGSVTGNHISVNDFWCLNMTGSSNFSINGNFFENAQTPFQSAVLFSGAACTNNNAGVNNFKLPAFSVKYSQQSSATANTWVTDMSARRVFIDSDATLTTDDYVIAYTFTSAPRNVTLPTGLSTNPQHFVIKDEGGTAATGNIRITGTVNGAVNPTAINTNYGTYRFYWNGAAYFTE